MVMIIIKSTLIISSAAIIAGILSLSYSLLPVSAAEYNDPYLTNFNYGDKLGPTTRHFTLLIEETHKIPISSPNNTDTVYFPAWTFNGTIPGPTMRMTEGDTVLITVKNSETSKNTHSLHMHSIHPPSQDGTFGPSGAIKPGDSFTYRFTAGPAGLYPYHCHVEPIQTHINRGLYGAMIIDPKTPMEPANEMVMMMNSYDLDLEGSEEIPFRTPNTQEASDIMFPKEDATEEDRPELEQERDNEFYTVNGKAFQYMDNPIKIKVGEPVRIYLLSMTEFDPLNSFHLHSDMFNYTASGTENTPAITTDIVTLGQGDRGIIEFTPKYPGKMMFHAHINEFTQLGWMGMFEAVL